LPQLYFDKWQEFDDVDNEEFEKKKKYLKYSERLAMALDNQQRGKEEQKGDGFDEEHNSKF